MNKDVNDHAPAGNTPARLSNGTIDNILSKLDQGAAHQGYAEGFGFSWTQLAGDAATIIRRLRRPAAPLARSAATSAIPRPLKEWHEDMGPMLWWKFPIEEEPYVGSPLDIGFTVQFDMEMTMRTHTDPEGEDAKFTCRRDVGGWPGYHTHFTPIPQPEAPADPRNDRGSEAQ